MNEDGIWQNLLKRKYVKDKCLTQIGRRPGDSHFWSCLMEAKLILLQYGRFKVNNGCQTRFWEDVWVGHQSLKQRFPSLYSLVRRTNVSVAMVLSSTLLNVSFRRAIVGQRPDEWLRLVTLVMPVILNNDKDRFIWLIKKDGVFTTQSLYKEIMKEEKIGGNGIFWKTQIPLKIKIFLWYLKRGVVLTKDNLLKRRWKGDSKCKFCGLEETIQHLFSIVRWPGLFGIWCLL